MRSDGGTGHEAEAAGPRCYVHRRLVDALYVGPSLRLQAVELAEVEDGALLDGGTIEGSDGGLTVQLAVSAFWDTPEDRLQPGLQQSSRLFVEALVRACVGHGRAQASPT